MPKRIKIPVAVKKGNKEGNTVLNHKSTLSIDFCKRA